MECPYCRKAIHEDVHVVHLGFDDSSNWAALTRQCPACKKLIVGLMRVNTQDPYEDDPSWYGISEETIVMPRVPERDPIPPEVPSEFTTDYEEACRILIDSPQASAALSRRCLQHILRECAGVEASSLFREIQSVVDRGAIPPYLVDALQEIRVAGNLAAHPMKSGRTAEIVKVEHVEAERSLAVIEALFDFYFVRPEREKQQRDALFRKFEETKMRRQESGNAMDTEREAADDDCPF